MNKLEETNFMIDHITKLNELGIEINTVVLVDIARSLAMIADKLYEVENEDD